MALRSVDSVMPGAYNSARYFKFQDRDMTAAALLILAGAFAAGFVSGLTGFGTALTALSFWLLVIGPILAAPLAVICSVVAHMVTIRAIWHAVDVRRVLPFVIGGALGVPVGTVLLAHVSVGTFKLTVGALLVVYCGFMLLGRWRPHITWEGRVADGAVGLSGGVLGGLAGLSGLTVVLWATLHDWTRDKRRGVIQAFNMCVLGIAFVAQCVAGLVTLEVGRLVLIALPGTVAGAWLGRRVYSRLGDDRFNQVVLVLLLVAGINLIASNS